MNADIVWGALSVLGPAVGIYYSVMKNARHRRRWKAALAVLGFNEAGPRTEEEASIWQMFTIRDESEVYVGQLQVDDSRQCNTYVDVYFSSPLGLSLEVVSYSHTEGHRSLRAYRNDPAEIQALRLSEFFSHLPTDTTIELDDTKLRLKFFGLHIDRLEPLLDAAERLAQQITTARASMPTHVHGEHLAKVWKAANKHRFEYAAADCELHRSTPAGSITIGDWLKIGDRLNKPTWATYISIELWSPHPEVNQNVLELEQGPEADTATPTVRTLLIALQKGLGNTIESFSIEPDHIVIELRVSLGEVKHLALLERLLGDLLTLTHALGNLEKTSSFGPFRTVPGQSKPRTARKNRSRKASPLPKTCSKCSKDLRATDTHTKDNSVFCETCYWRHY